MMTFSSLFSPPEVMAESLDFSTRKEKDVDRRMVRNKVESSATFSEVCAGSPGGESFCFHLMMTGILKQLQTWIAATACTAAHDGSHFFAWRCFFPSLGAANDNLEISVNCLRPKIDHTEALFLWFWSLLDIIDKVIWNGGRDRPHGGAHVRLICSLVGLRAIDDKRLQWSADQWSGSTVRLEVPGGSPT
jgi:hypothetical protein